jgi:phosphate/sulfate permease/Flp pilus assembly protein TadD
VRKVGVGQGIAYHADTVDKLDALKNDGNECFRSEQYDGAIAAYSAAIAIAPETGLAPLYCSRSAAYNKKGHKEDHELALNDAQEAIDLQPNPRLLAKAHLRLGEANEQLGRYKLARAAFERALELEPESKIYREALYRVLAQDGQLKASKRSVLDMISNRNSAMGDSEAIPEITMTHSDFATLDDLTVDIAHDGNFTHTSAKLMIAQTPGVQGGHSFRKDGHHSPVGNREKRSMRAEKLVQHAARGAHSLSEHQHRQRAGHAEVDLEEQREYADSHCKEYVEHVQQLAREQMADAITQDWSKRLDDEMQTRILAEDKAKTLQRHLNEQQELLHAQKFANRPVFVVSRLQTVARSDAHLPALKIEDIRADFEDMYRWPKDSLGQEFFTKVNLLQVVQQIETDEQKNKRLQRHDPEAPRWPYWVLEFEAQVAQYANSPSVAEICKQAHTELRSTAALQRFDGAYRITGSSSGRQTVVVELQTDKSSDDPEGEGLLIPEFQREDLYEPVKKLNAMATKPKYKKPTPEGKLVFKVRNYYWPCGSVPSEAIKGQPQPVKEGLAKSVWLQNGWKECHVGPSQPVEGASDTTLTHRRAAHRVRATQGGYADLVCISAMATSFLQGASDFLVSMAPLVIIYEVYGDDGSEGGLDWILACPPERIGLEYTEFSMGSTFTGFTDVAGRRALLVLSTCEDAERTCMLQNSFAVGGSQILFGVICLGLGAIGLGHRTLNRLSFELITSCAPADGFCATTAATIVWALFLLAGIPISLTYLTVGAMIGMALGIGVDGPKIGCTPDISKIGLLFGVGFGSIVGVIFGLALSKPGIGLGIGIVVSATLAVGEAAFAGRVLWNRFLAQVLLGFATSGLVTGVVAAGLFSFTITMVPTERFEPLLWKYTSSLCTP